MKAFLIVLIVVLSLTFSSVPRVVAQAPEGRVVAGFNAGFDSLDPHNGCADGLKSSKIRIPTLSPHRVGV